MGFLIKSKTAGYQLEQKNTVGLTSTDELLLNAASCYNSVVDPRPIVKREAGETSPPHRIDSFPMGRLSQLG
jgi:hypothetical protein